jgi:segregation and condensation protein B
MIDEANGVNAEPPEEEELDGQEPSNEAVSSEDMRILEALLFASEEVLTPARIKSIIPNEPDLRKIRKMVAEINARLQSERHPFEIAELGGGFQFRTIAFYHPWVRQLFKERSVKKLSMQALECLAIIAYKQPITKAEIEAIRGVVSDGAMKTLLERHMVTIVGRSDKAGRPLLYGTTPEFIKYFGINKISDLPQIEEFEALAREKMEELSDEELQLIDSLPDEKGEEQQNQQTESGDETAPVQGEGKEGAGGQAPERAEEEGGEGKGNEEEALEDEDANVAVSDDGDGEEDGEERLEDDAEEGGSVQSKDANS